MGADANLRAQGQLYAHYRWATDSILGLNCNPCGHVQGLFPFQSHPSRSPSPSPLTPHTIEMDYTQLEDLIALGGDMYVQSMAIPWLGC